MAPSWKNCPVWLAVLLLPLFAAMPIDGAKIATNGNGEAVDVGIWYCANWDANGGGWWPLSTYRPLLPDGQYGMHDGADITVIDYHLQQLADAKIDFIVFDDSNGDFNHYGPENAWIKEKSKSVCARIKLWNGRHSCKIRYAFCIGSLFIGDREYLTAKSYDVIEQQARCIAEEIFDNRMFQSGDYYKIDGKPLLVVLTIIQMRGPGGQTIRAARVGPTGFLSAGPARAAAIARPGATMAGP